MPLPGISLKFPDIKTIHRRPYPAISPLKPENSQAGRTVLITGGAGGIGFAEAKAFIQAGAAHVIVTSRREGFLKDGVARLEAEAQTLGGKTKISGYASDAGSIEEAKKLWNGFKESGIDIDVLVLNATVGGVSGPLINHDVEQIWKVYEINVLALLSYTKLFHEQLDKTKKKFIVFITTDMAHNLNISGEGTLSSYALTKNAGQVLMQQIAQDMDPDHVQITSVHPGYVFTEGAEKLGVTDDMLEWDDVELPAQTVVWAATDDAKRFHGRYLAAWWDVDELKGSEIGKKLDEDWHFLRVGVKGIDTIYRTPVPSK
ncbi:hypothetical protein QBC38DRAFT_458237 [Podospora fimiseda]|uniref:Uncharacterized protein n=1 Tax=Podospora fimiseda TaxID=252190 RepID=A0AAN7BJK8_9PEZI|nr:hypothetical protein QBC38DRAFT_458237 [Podospora fimiseda]